MSLIDKLLKVMADMGNIEKRGVYKGGSSSYNYVTNDDLTSKLQTALVKNSVLIIPHIDNKTQTPFVTKGGTPGTLTELDLTFEITDGSGESIKIPWKSEATDYGDKGIAKALTLGKKYFAISLFQVATGDERDDADGQNEEIRRMPKPEKPEKPSPEKDVQKDVDTITKDQLQAYEDLAATALKHGIRSAVIDLRMAKPVYEKIYANLLEKVNGAKES